MHFKLNNIKIDGFAVNSAEPGQHVFVTQKNTVTSESTNFFIYAEQISNSFFSQLPDNRLYNTINQYLLIVHPDYTADLYINDFNVVLSIRPKRSIKAGQEVYTGDVEEISEVIFPDIPINENDQVVYLRRNSWRFGIFFDLTRKIELKQLGSELAKLQEALLLDDILVKTLSYLRKKEIETISTNKAPIDAHVITEGKTDWMHIEHAFKEIGFKRNLIYSKSNENLGDSGLLEICRRAIHLPMQQIPIICIFDNDNPAVQKELAKKTQELNGSFQSWGNNVYSMLLPIPDHRIDYKHISIEMYYSDAIIRKSLPDGKRLFFDNELKLEKSPGSKSRWIQIHPVMEAEYSKKVFGGEVNEIVDEAGNQVGLSKTAFAELIIKKNPPFDSGIDFISFRKIAAVIEAILGPTK